MNDKKKQPNLWKRWWLLCPVRHCLLLFELAALGAYLLLRGNGEAMADLCGGFVRPWHRLFARMTAALPFSLAELLIVLTVLGLIAYGVVTIVLLKRRPSPSARVCRFVLSCAALGLGIYALFCWLWGVYYYTSDFEAQSGIYGRASSVEELETVTRRFTELVNEYGEQVPRSETGEMNAPLGPIFSHSPLLYGAVEQDVPCLAGDPVPAKPFFFSRCMSYADFSGFFFPFTAEANINTDCPPALIPSTIAHELAHQRGVAQEDEANFAAVLACLADGDPIYCYSACLLAYIHLGNALYKADYDAWLENYQRLSLGVRADLEASNRYWSQFRRSVVTKVSDSVYTGFLHSYGQTLGLQTYGKCVDLLVAYYSDTMGELEE